MAKVTTRRLLCNYYTL